MAKTFKPTHSRNRANVLKPETKVDAVGQVKEFLDAFQPQKKIRGGSQNLNVTNLT